MDKSTKNSKSLKKSKKSSKSCSDGHNQRLVEYSDVSSNELSAPEAGELPSDGLSIVSDDEISTVGTNNNNSIYEPIDDDDEELEKLMDGDGFSDTFSDSNKRKKKQKKKQKKVKKSKKRKKRRRSSEESIEEISDDEALLDSVDDGKHSKRIDEGGTPPLDQISYTPKNKFDGYTPISPGDYTLAQTLDTSIDVLCVPGTSPILNASPESLNSADIPPGTTSINKRSEYRSPHTPPMPKKIDDLSRGHGVSGGRQSSLSSSTSAKTSSKKRHPTPERSSSYRKRTRSRDRDNSPYEYESRRYRERDRVSSPYGSRKYRDRRRRSR
jgi:hypothetical protein